MLPQKSRVVDHHFSKSRKTTILSFVQTHFGIRRYNIIFLIVYSYISRAHRTIDLWLKKEQNKNYVSLVLHTTYHIQKKHQN